MKTLPEIFQSKDKTFSIEFFPPKTDSGYQKLQDLIVNLAKIGPDFMTCTYGAGGGSRDRTLDIVQYIQDKTGIPGVAHLTCVLHTRDEIRDIFEHLYSRGIKNILALRGDPPKDNPGWEPGPENFQYSCELVSAIRERFGHEAGIGVAGFPEGHILCPDRDQDARYLKTKIDAGADAIITQLFFDNRDYFDYVRRLRDLGIQNRVIPGVLPITDYHGLLRFTSLCGATVTDEVKKIFEPIADDKEKTLAAGKKFALKQCRELLDGGAPGIHFYCLNKYEPVASLLKSLKD